MKVSWASVATKSKVIGCQSLLIVLANHVFGVIGDGRYSEYIASYYHSNCLHYITLYYDNVFLQFVVESECD